ncbi:expressed protein, partial [Phakopsora pachyrhizi]
MFYSVSFLLHFYFFLIFSSSLIYKCAAQLDMLSQQIILYHTHYFSHCQSIAQFHCVSFFLLIFAHQYIFVVCFH